MLPIRLTIKGIYSYREEQTIGFDKLTEAHIFGIFGSVGSGKSTILEAITFALYGDTERLNSRENRAYNMMNLKSNELKIDFEFKVADQEYRVVVVQKRKKKFSEIDTANRVFYKKVSEQWEAQEHTDSSQAIGLSYENFRRTIIIPQGKFQEFLQLSATDRSRMLSEIFSLQKYELADKVNALSRKNSDNILVKETQLTEIGAFSEENFQQAESQIAELAGRITEQSTTVKSLQQQFQAFEQLKTAFDKLTQIRGRQQELDAQKETIEQKATQLADYEAVQLEFRLPLEQEALLQKDLTAQLQTIASAKEEQQKLSANFTETEKQFKALEAEQQLKDTRREEAEDLLRISDILKAEQEAQKLQLRKAEGEKKFEELRRKKEDNKAQLQTLTEELKKQKAALPDSALITEISLWFNNKQSIQQSLNGLTEQYQQQEQQLQSLIAQKTEQLKQSGFGISKAEDIFQLLKKAESDILENEQKQKTLEIRHQLEQYAHNLHDGEPCPLCGSAEHPHVLEAGETSGELYKLNDELSKLKIYHTALQDFQLKWSHIQVREEESTKTLNATKVKLTEQQQVLANHLATFNFKGIQPDDSTAATTLQQQLRSAQAQISQLENQQEQNRQETEQLESQIKVFEEAFAKVDKLIDAELNKKQLRTAELRKLKTETFAQQNPEGIAQQAAALQEKIIQTEKQYQELESRRVQLREALLKSEASLTAAQQQATTLQSRLTESQKTLEEKIKKSRFADKQSILTILAQQIDIAAVKQQIDSFRQEIALLQERRKELEESLAGKNFDAEAYATLQQNLQQQEQQLKQLESEKSVQESRLADMHQKRQRAEKLLEELTQLRLRRDNLNTLAGLFKASGFVRYISNIYLQQLCNAANVRFHKLTRQSLQLEVDDKENLNVRDFMNDGQVRSVKTLSGGQTFQASLCLALALADSIQSLTRSDRNFFFLDEGFGSLDKESLQTVFDTLKSLRKENRIVGVISHVEELQQEIDSYLSIRNDPDRGSIIKGSWE